MPVPNGECQTKNERNHEKDDDEKPIRALDEGIYFMLNRHSYIICLHS